MRSGYAPSGFSSLGRAVSGVRDRKKPCILSADAGARVRLGQQKIAWRQCDQDKRGRVGEETRLHCSRLRSNILVRNEYPVEEAHYRPEAGIIEAKVCY